MARTDWANHPMGPMETWPAALRSLLRTMLASPDSMYLVWGADRTFFFNTAYIPILGPRLDQAMGARFEQLWADAFPSVEPLYLQALGGRASRSVDLFVPMARRGTPEETWWTFSYTPVFDADGGIGGVLCITNETTEKVLQADAEQRANAALRASERALRRAQDAGKIGIFSIDMMSNEIEGTDEFFRLFGLEPQARIPATVIENLVVVEDRENISHADTRLSQEIPLEVEYRIRRHDNGEMRCIERRGEFEYDEAGSAVRLVGVVQDVTDRRNDRDALARLNATLEAAVVERTQALLLHENIVQSDVTAICAFDTDYRLIAFNKAHNDEFFRVNGFYTKLGDVFWQLFVPEQRAAMKAQMARALSGESFTVEEAFGNPKIDAPRWEIHYSPLRNESGQIIGAFHHARDISVRLRAQSELAAAQEALRQAQKMEAMGQLTGGVAHDFNNLLTPILGALDLLMRKGVGDEREKRLIDGAFQSAERARTLVQRLLAFARRQPLQTIAVDVGALVNEMAELIASTTGPQIDVRVMIADDLPPAKADPNQVEMALLNLAVNARDAMNGEGTLTIGVTVEHVGADEAADLAPGDYLRLSVKDTGVGMDDATMARAVEPFFSTKGVGQGTGLGLSMVHGLASQLGGALRLASEICVGTTVELWLPQSATGLPIAAAPGDTRALEIRGIALLVDDEELVRLSTAAMLFDIGFQVVEAASADTALEMLDGGLIPDVVVTDHLMPGMTGSALGRIIKTRYPATPVLVISGYAEEDGLETDLARLTKPFRRDELAASLAALDV